MRVERADRIEQVVERQRVPDPAEDARDQLARRCRGSRHRALDPLRPPSPITPVSASCVVDRLAAGQQRDEAPDQVARGARHVLARERVLLEDHRQQVEARDARGRARSSQPSSASLTSSRTFSDHVTANVADAAGRSRTRARASDSRFVKQVRQVLRLDRRPRVAEEQPRARRPGSRTCSSWVSSQSAVSCSVPRSSICASALVLADAGAGSRRGSRRSARRPRRRAAGRSAGPSSRGSRAARSRASRAAARRPRRRPRGRSPARGRRSTSTKLATSPRSAST